MCAFVEKLKVKKKYSNTSCFDFNFLHVFEWRKNRDKNQNKKRCFYVNSNALKNYFYWK